MTRWRFRDWPIRRKVLLFVPAATIAPVSLAAVLVYFQAREIIERQAGELLAAVATTLASEIDSRQRVFGTLARTAAHSISVGELLTAVSPEARDKWAARAMKHILGIKKSNPVVTAIGVLERTGRVVLTTESVGLGLDVSFRPYFREAIRGRDAVSDLFMSIKVAERRSRPVVAYAAPVIVAGAPVGVAIVFVEAATIWEQTRSANGRVGEGSYAMLLDSHGIRLAHGRRDDFVFRPTGPLDRETIDAMVAEKRFGERTRVLLENPVAVDPHYSRARAATLDGLDRVYSYSSLMDREENLAVARRLSHSGWTLVSIVPKRSTEAAADRLIWVSFSGSVVVIAVAVLLGLLIARNVYRPIEALSRAAEVVAKGDLSARAKTRLADEVGVLSARFNEMAAAIQESHSTLEQKVRERTTELDAANKELVAKQEEVERASRVKGEFLANMSHELRTPLNAIIGFSELLGEEARERLDPREVQYLKDVATSGRHLLALINDVLDVAKLEAGRMKLVTQALDPAVAIGEALGMVATAAVTARVTIREASTSLRVVRADENRLRQVLVNLLSNAVKFSPEGSNVEVGAEDAGEFVRFFVRDEGPGIEDGLRPKLFNAFVQGDSTLRKTHHGTGLGLVICKKLIEQHGGEIGVESEVGRGATFWFTVPVANGGSEIA